MMRQRTAAMRRRTATGASLLWFIVVGGTFGALLPYLLGDWQPHRPLPHWLAAQVVGAVLIGIGLVPLAGSFVEFVRAGGTPIPVAAPPALVVAGFYRYVRNPIYVGFLICLGGQALILGSIRTVKYAVVAWCIGAAAVRWYEEPTLARRFGESYQAYRRAVPAWLPRLHAWEAHQGTGPKPAAPAPALTGTRDRPPVDVHPPQQHARGAEQGRPGPSRAFEREVHMRDTTNERRAPNHVGPGSVRAFSILNGLVLLGVLLQGLSAGGLLGGSGGTDALRAHQVTAYVVVIIALASAILATIRLRTDHPSIAVWSGVLLVLMIVQTALGQAVSDGDQPALLAAHVPLALLVMAIGAYLSAAAARLRPAGQN